MSDQMDSFDESGSAEAQRPEVHLADYIDVLLKRRRLILLCLGLGLVAGILGTVLTRPIYKATAVLDVVKQQSNPLGFGANQGLGADPEFLPSQIQLMQSREIGERVVRKLNLLADPDFNPKHYRKYQPDAAGKVKTPSEEDIVSAAIDVQGNSDAMIVRPTALVQLAYDAPSAKLAAAIANEIAEAYIQRNVESR